MSDQKTKNHAGDYTNLISFVPQSSQADNGRKKPLPVNRQLKKSLRGDDVKNFYESLICEGSSYDKTDSIINEEINPIYGSRLKEQSRKTLFIKNSSPGHTERKRTRSALRKKNSQPQVTEHKSGSSLSRFSVNPNQRNIHKLLGSAQQGDDTEISQLVSSGVDINASDMFGWTPLMCAAQAGHLKCVRLCLKYNADREVQNSSGQTAKDLALSAGHVEVASAISTYDNDEDFANSNRTKTVTLEPLWCNICKLLVSPSEIASHSTSTVHLFNSGHKPAPPTYLIPESNRGFQMLLRKGWEVDQGLGPRRDGKRYPIKTIFKQDRKGLGVDVSKNKSKITHFEAFDKNAVSQNNVMQKRVVSARRAAKNNRKAKEKRIQRKVREIRFELS